MADYSKDLFSFEGDEPHFLPSRIRLPNKQTRSPHDVSLEELNDCGYTGPIYKPEFDKNSECLVWNEEDFTYSVGAKAATTAEEKLNCLEAKGYIDRCIDLLFYNCPSLPTDEYKVNAFNYLRQLYSLDTSNCRESDFLSFIAPFASDVSLVRDLLSSDIEYNEEIFRACYENFGFVFALPPGTEKYFEVPSHWGPIVYNQDYVFHREHTENEPFYSLIGVNKYTGSSLFTLPSGLEFELKFGRVYFPHG